MTNINVRLDDNVKQEAEILFDKLGMTISGAVNVFFRQAIREQAIPFSISAKTAGDEKYNEYFTPQNIESIIRSAKQMENGDYISFTMEELYAMEDGEIPQRALDFLEKARS